MKLVKSKYEIIEQSSGLEGIYKNIELVGKVSHKSEGNIKEGSAKTFVDNMIKLGHNATLEFGTVYMKMLNIPLDPDDVEVPYGNYFVADYIHNPYSKVVINHNDDWMSDIYVTTNMRVLIEHNRLKDLNFLCEPTEYHEKRYCVKFTCDRGILAEFTRHRSMSFMAESTRFCNYSNGRFNHEITYIIPSWANIPEGQYTLWEGDWCDVPKTTILKHYDKDATDDFLDLLKISEFYYFSLLDQQWKPEQARQVLPNALKTELYMCGFASDWKHFFELRDSKFAHPDAYALAHPLHEEFIKRNYI